MLSKISRIIVPLSLIAVVYVNYLATQGAIGGITPAYISDKYPTYLTPAGYAFSIWSLIYLGMLIFSIHQLLKGDSEYLDKIRYFFIASCLANIAWIFAWHNQNLGLSVVAMLTLLSSLILINLESKTLGKGANTLFVRIPFSIYFGWVSVATILNISIFLTSLGSQAGETASNIIAIALLATVTVVGIIVREKLNIPLYPLTIAWALTAIAVKQSGKTAVVAACAIAVIALIISSLSFFIKTDQKIS